MIETDIRSFTIDLDGGSLTVPVSSWAWLAVQVIPEHASTTGTIEVKRSLTGNAADAVSFATAVTPNMTSKAIIDEIDIRDTGYLHITTTADGTKKATVWLHLSEA